MAEMSFTQDKVYAVRDLNGILGGLVCPGVIGRGCSVVLRGSDSVCVMKGMAVMPDGLLVTVDSDGVMLDRKRYIYFDSGVPCSSDTEPTGNVLILAEITDGRIIDRRSIARIYFDKEGV